jgi:hypothetical protein
MRPGMDFRVVLIRLALQGFGQERLVLLAAAPYGCSSKMRRNKRYRCHPFRWFVGFCARIFLYRRFYVGGICGGPRKHV